MGKRRDLGVGANSAAALPNEAPRKRECKPRARSSVCLRFARLKSLLWRSAATLSCGIPPGPPPRSFGSTNEHAELGFPAAHALESCPFDPGLSARRRTRGASRGGARSEPAEG